MKAFGAHSLRAKLALLTALAALATICTIVASTALMYHRMIDDRIDKLRAITTLAEGLAQSLQDKVDSHEISQAEALATFRQQIHRLRFGSATDYLIVYSADDKVLIHGGDPSREGKLATAHDEHGRSSMDLAREVLRAAPGGAIYYLAAKPAQAVAQMKVTYVAEFQPWQLVFMAGDWIDDINAQFRATLLRLALIGAAALGASLVAAWLISRDIAGSLGRLKRAMEQIAGGTVSATIPGLGRRDEVGAMAASLQVFQDNISQTTALRESQEDERRASLARNRAALLHMADEFEAQIGQLVETLSVRSAALDGAAQSMAGVAGESTDEAAVVAQSAEAASRNLETVAAAAEQLATSIGEIRRQVGNSMQITDAAVAGARRTDMLVQALAANAERIGTVIGIISGIAAKTNLLALNATIEAARAGEAGRGFSVVASEVKTLANQTSVATQEISQQVAEIQSATRNAVDAVAGIAASVHEISGLAGAIASAVSQQSSATSEIARSVQQTFEAARQVTLSSSRVRQAAGKTGSAASQVSAASSELSQQTRQLGVQVDSFVAGIRAA